MAKKNHFIGKFLVLFLFFVASLVTFGLYGDKVEKDIARLDKSYTAPSQKVAGVAVEKTTLTINRGEGTTLNFNIEPRENMTVLDVLNEVNAQYNIGLETKKYDFGVLVNSLADRKSGDGGKYWIYLVNGQMPANAVDQQAIRAGDKIEFQFEKSTF